MSKIFLSMKKENLNNSQKFVILNELLTNENCLSTKPDILKELTRLQSLPLLKESEFDSPISKYQNILGCKIEVQKMTNGNQYVRLVMVGETKAFAIISISQDQKIIGFEPLLPIKDIANLPISDPCVALARRLADIPMGDNKEQIKILAKLSRLKTFDSLPKIDKYIKPAFSYDSNSLVLQGTGKASKGPLHTEGMMPCVGLAVLNRSTKKAFLIHADARTNSSVLIDKLTIEIGAGNLEAVVAGGDSSVASRETLYQMLQALDRNKIKILGYRLNPTIDSLAVDPQEGKFY